MKRKILGIGMSLALVLGMMSPAFAETYSVKSGDVLWKIAKQYGTTWQELSKLNNLQNPNLIFPNQKITIADNTSTIPEVIVTPKPVAVEPVAVEPVYADYYAKLDTKYAYDIAIQLSENKAYSSSSLGTRTAGSDAEHAAADFIAKKMTEIGLKNVEKVGVDVDKWQFNDATLSINGSDKVIKPHSYATSSTPVNGIDAEILFVGNGTMADYKDVEVKGKIVLIDIDQRANWWITFPMLEAEFQGAAAIMSANVGGFAQISGDALNSQDICGPPSIPCVSISLNDSNYIKGLLAKGPVTSNLKVDNVVEPGGTSYNIMGKTPGKNSDEMIVVGSHYDMYFKGFQDDSIAVGLDLAMAKAMIDSGYVPERDIVFVIHGAEEWGASNTQFDWTTGAWRMINEAHPEWVGKTLAFLNFELPAYEFADYTSAYSAPELYSLIKNFALENPNAPVPVNCFAKGFKTEGYQTYTYSDDFSYYAAGVPSIVNGFLLTLNREDVFPFYYDRYHSQFDNASTYNENVLKFNLSFYGAMAIAIDQTPALELDYAGQYDRLSASLDDKTGLAAGADVASFKAALAQYKSASTAALAKVETLNTNYKKLLAEGASAERLLPLWKEAKKLNASNLSIFKKTQDAFLGLMYERPIVPHEAPQENIKLMQSCIDGLKADQINKVVDEDAWMVNNVLEWYNYSFSPEVTKRTNDMFYAESNKNNLFWGTGKMFAMADVEEATRSLYAKYDTKGSDYTKEIGIYEREIKIQQELYVKNLGKETIALKALIAELNAL